MTQTERCRILESSLPVAPYRATLTALHDEMLTEIEAKDALLRQVLNDICGAKLCEVNSMSSRAEARRLLDKATDAIRARLGETT